MSKSPWWQLVKPRYWLLAPILFLLRVVVYLPYHWQMVFGRGLGRFLIHIDRKGRHTSEVNLKLCFPELSSEQRRELLFKSYESVGQSIIETALAWFGTDRKLSGLLHVHGLEYLKEAQREGKGAMLMSAHLACLEICGRLFSAQQTLSVVYRDQKLVLLDQFAKYYRRKFYTKIIAREDLRAIIRGLHQGEFVWYTPDVDGGRRNSIFAPFFGIPTATITMTARLAALTDAKVIPLFFYRRADGKGYDLCMNPPLENFPSGDVLHDASLVNKVIEHAIRKAPEQYLWQYKRFKTRPEGEKRFY